MPDLLFRHARPRPGILADGLSPAIRFLGSLRSLGMTIRDLGPGMTKGRRLGMARKNRGGQVQVGGKIPILQTTKFLRYEFE